MKKSTVLRGAMSLALLAPFGTPSNATTVTLDPRTLVPAAKIDPRYQSYNVELVSIIGGQWWAPYRAPGAAEPGAAPASPQIGADTLSEHAPLDLANARLRHLAAALGPAYMRVSDKWANSTFFQDHGAALTKPPSGFDSVLTAARWKTVIQFAKAADASLVTSFAISPGTRSANGVWTPTETGKVLRSTREAGGSIAAAEFFNEPNLAVIEGAPKDYTAADYGRDFKIFSAYLRRNSPQTKLFGPGAVGERKGFAKLPGALSSGDMLQASGGGLDGLSYHFYGAFSQRCANMGAQFQIQPAAALSPEWLNASLDDTAYYGAMRNLFIPGRPLWLTETAQAACGGDRWAAQFLDTFRYLNQLGLLAGHGVGVSMHNTLVGSDYGLIDQATMQPRPNYWGALLWRKLVGTTVFRVNDSKVPNLYLYAFDLRGAPGGTAILAINADPGHAVDLDLKRHFRRYTLSAPGLDSATVLLNGHPLALDAAGRLPVINGAPGAGVTTLAPGTITFLAIR